MGLLVCALTYGLREVDFGPLRDLVELEDRAYQAFSPPTRDFDSNVVPIVFVDVDEAALTMPAPAPFIPSCGKGAATALDTSLVRPDPSAGTPRGIIARITQIMRAANVGVIYLDYDLRNELSDDPLLRAELACNKGARVLLPHYLSTGVLPSCGVDPRSNKDGVLSELPTAFDKYIDADRVRKVHPIISSGRNGLIEGVCPSFRVLSHSPCQMVRSSTATSDAASLPDGLPLCDVVQLSAAMVSATAFARPDLPEPCCSLEQLQRIRWWVDGKTPRITARNGRLFYLRIEASVLLRDATLIMNALAGSIVIVGSTHQGAGDFYDTPVGDLPGALVHANFGIERQAPQPWVLSLPEQFIIEIPFLLLSTGLAIRLRLYWEHRVLESGRKKAIHRRVILSLSEFGIVIISAILFLLFIVLLAKIGLDLTTVWRFGILSFSLGAVIVALIELISAFGECVEIRTEACIARRERRAIRESGRVPAVKREKTVRNDAGSVNNAGPSL